MSVLKCMFQAYKRLEDIYIWKFSTLHVFVNCLTWKQMDGQNLRDGISLLKLLHEVELL